MKKSLILFLLMITCLFASAQWVTIPDANFANKLSELFPECVEGNQLDTTCTEIINSLSLDISNSIEEINDLTGIKYFINLDTLFCSDVGLTTLSELPNGLNCIDCSDNNLYELTQLPIALRELNCHNNFLSELPLLPDSLEKINCSDNYINELNGLPNSLKYLDCEDNIALDMLPELPASLEYLNCSFTVNFLPELPESLTHLICRINSLNELPDLPESLIYLDCSDNSLSQLPILPNSLIELDCKGNNITSLPELPDLLSVLACSNNDLSTLPELPAELTILTSNNNDITVLPQLPNLLSTLSIWNNLLSELPALPNQLNSLNCASNNLTSIPNLPNSLSTLRCYANELTILPVLPNLLDELYCSSNNISELPELPPQLSYLYCSSNNLIMLPQLPDSLERLNCSNNALIELPELPDSLEQLLCYNNNLTYLPELSSTLTDLYCQNNQIICLPSIPNIFYLDVSSNPFTCLPNYTYAMTVLNPELLEYPLCDLSDLEINPYGCSSLEGIAGTVFEDENANCEENETEPSLPNIPMYLLDQESNVLATTHTLSNNVYNFIADTGTYYVQFTYDNLPFQPSCNDPGDEQEVILTEAEPSALSIDFGVKCIPNHDIGTQSVTTTGWVFPGQMHTLRVAAGDISSWYGLQCAEGVSGTVTVNVDGPVSYIEPAEDAFTPTVSGELQFTYDIADFGAVNFQQEFALLLETNITTQIGEPVCVDIVVDPIDDDYNPDNNTYTHCYEVTNSYDPNIKQVWPQDVEPGYDGYFNYTIYFQNTGTAPAFNIRVADTLDTNLDLSTFQVTGYSHDCLTYVSGNVATFRFNNIMLPDSTSDFDGSIGYVQYRVKPLADLPVGTIIENTAHIFFDFNDAIVTNTTENEFVITTSTNELQKQLATVFPNPGTGHFNVLFRGVESGLTTHLEVYNLNGQRVLQQQGNENRITLDLTDYPSGMYLLHLQNARGSEAVKLLKQ